MHAIAHQAAIPAGIVPLSFEEIDIVDGGLNATQVRDIGNASAALAAGFAVVGAEPVAGFFAGFAIGCYIVAPTS